MNDAAVACRFPVAISLHLKSQPKIRKSAKKKGIVLQKSPISAKLRSLGLFRKVHDGTQKTES